MGVGADEYSSLLLFRFAGIGTNTAFDESIEELPSGCVRSG
jgi:hypothetical protein